MNLQTANRRSWLWLPLLIGLTPLGVLAETELPLDQDVALTSFDQVWDQVRTQYFDFERIESEWHLARETLRPQAAETQSIEQLRALLAELLGLIGESHFGIVPAEWMNRLATLNEAAGHTGQGSAASSGLRVRLVGDQVLISDVLDGRPAARAGIRRGWLLEAVNDKAIAEILASIDDTDEEARTRARQLLEFALHERLAFPDDGRELSLRLIDPAGERQERQVTPTAAGIALVQLGQLPPMPFEFDLGAIETDDHCVTILRFSSWVPQLNQALEQQRERLLACPGLIIDLRGNPGGVMSTMVNLAADLVSEPIVLGQLMRADGHVDFRVMPRRVAMDGTRLQPISGPVANLIDSLSASTSEMFASGMQAAGRARVFGETSAGMALPAQLLRLASGDSLMYAFADYRDGAGRRIEGQGVTADEVVALTPATLSDPSSPVLQAALHWITAHLDSGTAAL